MNTQPILIIGAGPVGLSAALFLEHPGCPVRIVDANEARTTPRHRAMVAALHVPAVRP